jgi:hypothetical protein
VTSGVEVDLDRLADFVGGALDGTPDADDVRRLIDSDDDWADAYTTLVAADAAVSGQLRSWGADPAPIPDDVVARLDAALAGAVVARTANTAPAVQQIYPGDELAARRRKRQRFAIGLATAAAVLVCGAGGVTLLQLGTSNTDADKSSSAGSAANGGPGENQNGAPNAPDLASPDRGTDAAGGSGGPLLLVASGTDYAAATLAQVIGNAAQSRGSKALSGAAPAQPPVTGVPGELQRLITPTGRNACLTAIAKEYGGTVALVDYARYDGAPAVVVVLDGSPVAPGRRLAVVVGPACGEGGAIRQELYHTAL